jgi:hypothetical protein
MARVREARKREEKKGAFRWRNIMYIHPRRLASPQQPSINITSSKISRFFTPKIKKRAKHTEAELERGSEVKQTAHRKTREIYQKLLFFN